MKSNTIRWFVMGFSFLCGCASIPPSQSISVEPMRIQLWPEETLQNISEKEIVQIADKGTLDERRNLSNIHRPEISVYLPDTKKATGTGVLICPGGGYGFLSIDKEGIEIAKWFNSIGVAAFVLKYRLKEYGHPAPLNDAQRALCLIRSKADDFNLDPDRIGIIGFSAGGHLASTAATHFRTTPLKTEDPLDAYSNRPDFLILLYPVISMQDSVTHQGSKRNLLGRNPDQEIVDLFSNELQVTDHTPPTFIAHAADDSAVPVLNSILFYTALIKAGVPAEMHIYEKGRHGFGMRAHRGIAPANWPIRCTDWLRQRNLLNPGSEHKP